MHVKSKIQHADRAKCQTQTARKVSDTNRKLVKLVQKCLKH
jgi:hypothetical protein